MSYRSGVPESEAVGPASLTPVWRCWDKRTGAYLGVIARDCPTAYAACERASRLWQIEREHIGVAERKTR